MNTPLLKLIAAHFVADILLQPMRLAKLKDIRLRALLLHGAIVTLAAFFFPPLDISIRWAAICLTVGLAHLIIDKLRRICFLDGLLIGILDQLTHILSILLILIIFT